MSFAVLQEKINAKKNPTVMGLDPKLEYIPKHILDEVTKEFGKTKKAVGEALFRFNKGLIDACCDLVPAVKPQSAYYEMYGLDGLEALYKTVEYAKSKDLYVILDGKRGDIGSTAEAYSAAYLGETDIFGIKRKSLDCDCLTVNPYLGIDGIQPFIDDCKKYDKSIFVLVKTSNKSSGDFQDIIVKSGKTLYERVAQSIVDWGNECKSEYKYNPVGAVVGATYPEQLASLRKTMPSTFFLVPGFGAQGGAADDVKPAFDENGEGAVVNSSRAIMCAYMRYGDGRDFGERAREEVIRMRDAINEVIGK
ncbi:MAG: orotidine-5'-phosphate decarboxylase [Oscillospiraceae bacterium]|nr:orotidine-5'-phosphate decarboxylase [Oscillospiraceae bacterium]